MIFAHKKEVFTLKEFLTAPQPKNIVQSKKPLQNKYAPVYGFMGLDLHSSSLLSPSQFNAPYFIVLGVAGVLLLSTLMQNLFIAHGNTRRGEQVEAITKLVMPVAFYIFLVIGLLNVFF
jgi:hypothetical protein